MTPFRFLGNVARVTRCKRFFLFWGCHACPSDAFLWGCPSSAKKSRLPRQPFDTVTQKLRYVFEGDALISAVAKADIIHRTEAWQVLLVDLHGRHLKLRFLKV